MESFAFLLPVAPILIVVVGVWLLVSYLLYQILCGIDKKQTELFTAFEQKKKDWKIEKADVRLRVSALSNENARLHRMIQFELDNVKRHIGIAATPPVKRGVVMDNIVKVSQQTQTDVLEKFSIQNMNGGASGKVE